MPPIPKDIALLHGPTEDGKGARMLRLKEGTLYAGEVRPVREGQDIARQEVVRLKPIPNEAYAGQLCEVETLHAPSATADVKARSGPARVSNKSYRKNWGAVFGKSASGSRAQKKARQDYSVN